MNWAQDIKHFTPSEFSCPSLPGSGLVHMDLNFVVKIEHLRTICGFPFVIHSGYRTPEHNAKLPGAVVNSAHCSGHAVDIGCSTSHYRYVLIQEAIKMGFNRIGIAKSFIHLDDDLTKDQSVLWLY